MKTTVDARLLREARRFALRFACDDCAHFDPDHERCSLRFDAAPRQSALASRAPQLLEAKADITARADRRRAARVVEFCKAFELT